MLPGYGGNFFNLDGFRDDVELVLGDIRDSELMARLVADQDYVFHCAAQVDYTLSTAEPILDQDINSKGTLVLLEAARKHGPEAKIVFASSRLIYGKIGYIPVDEGHAQRPLNIYGVHKLAAESYLRIYASVYGLDTVTLRIPNPYGPRGQMKHSRYGLLNWLIRQVIDGETIRIFGDGQQKRDYVFIDDVVDAFICAARSAVERGDVYNIGSNAGCSLEEMVETVISAAGNGSKTHVPWPEDYEANETGDYVANTTKIFEATGWSPKVALTEGVRRTYEYYLNHRAHYW